MDDGMILLVNVSKGRLGEDSALLLGSLVVSTLGLAAFSRAELAPSERRPFFVYLDEFHNFTTLSGTCATATALLDHRVGEAYGHVQGESLKPCAALLTEAS